MDETLGDERLVTADNAEKLLEEMRWATAEEALPRMHGYPEGCALDWTLF